MPPGQGSINPTGPRANAQPRGGITTNTPGGPDTVNPTAPQPGSRGRAAGVDSKDGSGTNNSALDDRGVSASSGGSSRTSVEANYKNCVDSWDAGTHMTRSHYIEVCKRLRSSDEAYRQSNGGASKQ